MEVASIQHRRILKLLVTLLPSDAEKGGGETMIWLYVLAIIALLIGSAVFSASEMRALLGQLSAAVRRGGGRRAGRESRGALLDKYDDALSAILIGNNLCNIAADSIATVLVMLLLGARYNALASVGTTVVMTLLVIFLCESAPKIVAKKNANRMSMASRRSCGV